MERGQCSICPFLRSPCCKRAPAPPRSFAGVTSTPETWQPGWRQPIGLSGNQLPVQGGRRTGWPPPNKEWMGSDPPTQKKGAPTPSCGAKQPSPPPHKGASSRREPAAAQSFQDGFLACPTPGAPGFPLAPWNSFGEQRDCRPLLQLKDPQGLWRGSRSPFPHQRHSTPPQEDGASWAKGLFRSPGWTEGGGAAASSLGGEQEPVQHTKPLIK